VVKRYCKTGKVGRKEYTLLATTRVCFWTLRQKVFPATFDCRRYRLLALLLHGDFRVLFCKTGFCACRRPFCKMALVGTINSVFRKHLSVFSWALNNEYGKKSKLQVNDLTFEITL